MPATLKQLAEHTGLSIPTISEILNNKQRLYRDDTRKRVIEAAQQLGYRPNGSARSMKSGRFGVVALLQSSLGTPNYLPRTLLESIEGSLNEKNLLLLLGRVGDDRLLDQDSVPQLLKTWAADGLLVNYNSGSAERMMELIVRHHIPAIWINSKFAVDCVHPDDETAARIATEHLIGLGHERIAFVNYNFARHQTMPLHYSSLDRYNGYVQAINRAGLVASEIRPDQGTLPHVERVEYSLQWLQQPRRPTAVLTYSSDNAIAIMYAAQGMGLSIPGDLSVMTFDDHINGLLGTKIDSMVLPEAEMGRAAVERLLKKIEDPQLSFPAFPLPLQMLAGSSTAPPRPAIAGKKARSQRGQ